MVDNVLAKARDQHVKLVSVNFQVLLPSTIQSALG